MAQPIEAVELQRKFASKLQLYQTKVKTVVDGLLQERNEQKSKIQELESKVQAYESKAENSDDPELKNNILAEEMRTQLADAMEVRDKLQDQINNLTAENNKLRESLATYMIPSEPQGESFVSTTSELSTPDFSTESDGSSDANSESFLDGSGSGEILSALPRNMSPAGRKTSWSFSKKTGKSISEAQIKPQDLSQSHAMVQRSASAPGKNEAVNLTKSESSPVTSPTIPRQLLSVRKSTSVSSFNKSFDFADEDELNDPDIIWTTKSREARETISSKDNLSSPTKDPTANIKPLDIRGATLVKLVERLTSHRAPDIEYSTAFLLTYKSFTTSEQLFKLLINRYNLAPSETEDLEKFTAKKNIIRIRVGNVLRSWTDKNANDLAESPELMKDVTDFVSVTLMQDFESLAAGILRTLQNGKAQAIMNIPTDSAPAAIHPKNTNFIDFDPVEVARQMCVIEHSLFKAIKAVECLDQNWSKKDKDSMAPNIVTVIKRFNLMSNWVATEIVKTEKIKDRVRLVKHFIRIAQECKNLNNFNGVLEIIAGLQYTAIHRLKKTWDKIETSKVYPVFVELKDLMSNSGSYKKYRHRLHNVPHPCIPYLGVYLTDLTFIGDGNPDYLLSRPEMINFDKRHKTAGIIADIQNYQQTPYNFHDEKIIREYLLSVEGLTEKALYKYSLICEPKGGTFDTNGTSNRSLFKLFKFEI